MLTLLKRFVMTFLFFGALLTTWSSISNLSFADVQAWSSGERATSSASSEKAVLRETVLQDKELKTKKQQKRYISSDQIEGPQSLEEYVNTKDYPSATVTATGYTAGVESTGKTSDHPEYGITYSGVQVKRDLYSTIAADLDIYPIGTIMYIPGYGYGVVADKGGAINGNKIDLYYDTVEDVYDEWGKKEVEVYIVEEGDGTLSEEALNSLNENESMQVFRNQIVES
ncbi:3D domain-containing protein [Lentibacillus salinarum]|uniref:3D domain-containing protein n=1 Tax=Lentibacillus salinarum TaxID=446820 RepID=A0ABW3ZSW7_9BACI